MNPKTQLRSALCAVAAASAVVGWLWLSNSGESVASSNDYAIAEKPLYTANSVPPLMMLVASRDEQLFEKAYSDYSNLTDIDGDGLLDPTYDNSLTYEGYFDPELCYSYDEARKVFKAVAGRKKDHKCNGQWSGNFANWVSMSRLDLLRYVLYGGKRSADSASQTIIERAHLPNDSHAWSKVYRGSDIASYVPGGSAPMTFCNVSLEDGIEYDRTGRGAPLLRYASGAYPSWGVTEYAQCLAKLGPLGVDGGAPDGDGDRPARAAITNKVMRVEVCDPTVGEDARESFCRPYGSSWKPAGLLQEYGETGRLRFGMISGTYSRPRDGGVLRKNVGLFAGNAAAGGCATGDEVDLSNGTFCNQGNGSEGIVNTLDRFRLVNWDGREVGWNSRNSGGSWDFNYGWGNDCPYMHSNASIADPGPGSGAACTAWGNPISEMYAEALRYLAGSSPTGTFGAISTVGDATGAPRPAWVDPYGPAKAYGGGNNYCANCRIMILSSGTNTYDGNNIPGSPSGLDSAATATAALGQAEGINGSKYFVGSGATAPQANLYQSSATFVCTATTISNLAWVRGICDDAPQREGSYLVAGLAKTAYEKDLRSDLSAKGRPVGRINNVVTYAVALADTLPKIEIDMGGTGAAARVITLSPICKAGDFSSGRSCQLIDTQAGQQAGAGGRVYGRHFRTDGRAGSLMYTWDGAAAGESNDRDVTFMISYCVGSACNVETTTGFAGYDVCWGTGIDADTNVQSAPVCRDANQRPLVAEDEVLVRVEGIGSSSGGHFYMGFGITGAVSGNQAYPGVYRYDPPGNGSNCRRPNGAVCSASATFNLLTGESPDQVRWPMNNAFNRQWRRPVVVKFAAANQASSSLESPLWLAAKYGTQISDSADNDANPDWDNDGDGEPDNYLLARDPAKLKQQLRTLIEDAAAPPSVSGGGASGARLTPDASFAIDASFKMEVTKATNDWVGNLSAYNLNQDGTLGSERWSAARMLTSQAAGGARKIRMVLEPTKVGANGAVQVAAAVRDFTAGELASNPLIGPLQRLGLTGTESWMAGKTAADVVAYLKGATNGAPFRRRSEVLGDIVNSTLEIVSSKDDFGWGDWALQASPGWKGQLGGSYKEFVKNKNPTRNTAYVGANDGMLHAFDATASGGRERFAYIPSAVLSRMGDLANPLYDHRYTMDGDVVSGDVPTSASGDWRTVLLASAGAGGRSLSALDVTDPDGFGNASVLWELRGTNGNGSGAATDDLGHVLGRPAIVPIVGASATSPPRWVALFGNGVNSSTGAPVLFVVDVNTGAVLARLKPTGSEYAVRNGLMNVAPVALYNNDGLVDAVYGGDLQGNVWKFDLSGGAASSWSVAFGATPLFTAKDAAGAAQPITGGLEVSRGPGGGATVYFGTGRYFAVGDNIVSNPQVQSLYGIFDRCSSPACATPIRGDRTAVLGEQILSVGTNNAGYRVRNVSRNEPKESGWFIDLKVGTATGERFIGRPRLQNGKVFFTTFEPLGDNCEAGGRNWLFGVDMRSGGGSMAGVSTSPGGSNVCSGDCGSVSLDNKVSAPAKHTDVLLPPPPGSQIVGCGTDPSCSNEAALREQLATKQCSMVLRSNGSGPLYLPRPCGRQSWRQVR
ncbi:pilus assembly protein [Lysobacter enzymogenes]|uniref:pilus assembly protein n=1 Tax=Lysobacter enzymogenes TaxID=69 RepID=UPI001AF2E5C0|nr:PilC/PilY family type IV pilus protein [Lysobacter enzymogenes]QQQ02837.1 pilus assembly protein PilC [Lysobacter enzymogenes]